MKTSFGVVAAITTPTGGLHSSKHCHQRPSRVHLVPSALRGAKVLIRLNSTEEDLSRGINRAEHVRAYPEQDPMFERIFGIREDAESTNNLLKSQLWGRRLRTADPSRNDLDLALWALCQNVKALHAYRQRTGLSSRGDPARAA